jgi:hypothetical protein
VTPQGSARYTLVLALQPNVLRQWLERLFHWWFN